MDILALFRLIHGIEIPLKHKVHFCCMSVKQSLQPSSHLRIKLQFVPSAAFCRRTMPVSLTKPTGRAVFRTNYFNEVPPVKPCLTRFYLQIKTDVRFVISARLYSRIETLIFLCLFYRTKKILRLMLVCRKN